jgi:hypothetical protein
MSDSIKPEIKEIKCKGTIMAKHHGMVELHDDA